MPALAPSADDIRRARQGSLVGTDPKEEQMQIPKEQILELLRSRGEEGKASQAEGELPDQVDTEQHADLLQKLGIDPQDLLGKLGGGIPGL
jgi:hypothetical protein